jgi:integral membrane protein
MSTRAWVTLFKVVAAAEAVSWAGLLVGMYYKHVAGTTEAGVHLFGPIHGGIFVGYVLLTLVVARLLRWSRPRTLVGLACSVPPFATLLFEWWALRRGALDVPPTHRAGASPEAFATVSPRGDG